MDNSTVKLKAGDIMVQRGTNHAWANRSDKRARVAFVLVDAEPLGIGTAGARQRQRALSRIRTDQIGQGTDACFGQSPSALSRPCRSLALARDAAAYTRRTIRAPACRLIVPILGRRRHRHHGAHRRAAADRACGASRRRRQPAGGNYGSVGARRWAAAPPDGLTLLVTLRRHHHRQSGAVQPSSTTSQGFHADHRAVPRHPGAGGQLRRCRRTTCKELIALAKASPASSTTAPTASAPTRISAWRTSSSAPAPTSCTFPYRGAAPAAQALLAGDVSMLLLNLLQHRGARENREGEDSRRGRRQARARCGPTCRPSRRPACRDFRPRSGSRCSARRTCRRSWWRRSTPTSARCSTCRPRASSFKTNSFERVDLSPTQFGELIQSDLKHWSALIDAVGAKIE